LESDPFRVGDDWRRTITPEGPYLHRIVQIEVGDDRTRLTRPNAVPLTVGSLFDGKEDGFCAADTMKARRAATPRAFVTRRPMQEPALEGQ
jgi:hypothetical protein